MEVQDVAVAASFVLEIVSLYVFVFVFELVIVFEFVATWKALGRTLNNQNLFVPELCLLWMLLLGCSHAVVVVLDGHVVTTAVAVHHEYCRLLVVTQVCLVLVCVVEGFVPCVFVFL